MRFVRLGFLHILDGVDHLLFLFCLVIPFRRLKPLIVIVTAFTVAHSISLSAAVAGFAPDGLWFPPLIELLIAASIFYVAIENIVGEVRRCRDAGSWRSPSAWFTVLVFLRASGDAAVRGRASRHLTARLQRRCGDRADTRAARCCCLSCTCCSRVWWPSAWARSCSLRWWRTLGGTGWRIASTQCVRHAGRDASSILLLVRFSLVAVGVAALFWLGNRFYERSAFDRRSASRRA